jgi:ribulose-5-phosphate 4-epimerase/fuculose-1-phosphate aldolase
VSVQNEGLRRYTQFSMIVNNDLPITITKARAELDERSRIVNDLGDKNSLMLRNHGTLTVGENCAIAFFCRIFENARKTEI